LVLKKEQTKFRQSKPEFIQNFFTHHAIIIAGMIHKVYVMGTIETTEKNII
jgi:hypothetical protein